MNIDIKNRCYGMNYSFTAFQRTLENQTDQQQFLQDTACWLLSESETTARMLTFKHLFFSAYCKQLAGPCGCSEVLPDHLRIERCWEQVVIELFSAFCKTGRLRKMSNTRISRILCCILDTKYDLDGMVNRLKNPRPEYEWIHELLDKEKERFKPDDHVAE